MKSPKDLWNRALSEPRGCGVSECDLVKLERDLIDYRIKVGEPELFGFYVVRTKDEVRIVRAKNILGVRTDGNYRPMEE